jgi:hypothetical protein
MGGTTSGISCMEDTREPDMEFIQELDENNRMSLIVGQTCITLRSSVYANRGNANVPSIPTLLTPKDPKNRTD